MAHEGVVREHGPPEPYAMHTVRVAEMLAALGCADEVVAAGHLHDVIEDTVFTRADLAAVFGEKVAALVSEVTKPDDRTGNRAARKARDREHYAKATPAGATIKLADMIDNWGGKAN